MTVIADPRFRMSLSAFDLFSFLRNQAERGPLAYNKYPSVQKINTVDKTEFTIDGDQTNELYTCRDPVSRPNWSGI